MSKIAPGTICRIVGVPAAQNALVRTITYWRPFCVWSCEALQHLPGFQVDDDNAPVIIKPGEELAVPPENLVPLGDSGVEDSEVWGRAPKPAAEYRPAPGGRSCVV